jgi:hypothetical protein
MFEDFWALYPKKVAKGAAIKAWSKLTKCEKEEVIFIMPKHIKYWSVKGVEKEYIPYPASWLNQLRWLDELDFEPPKKPTLPWYSSDELTLAKAKEIGVTPYAGESFAQLRQRISTQISRQATV